MANSNKSYWDDRYRRFRGMAWQTYQGMGWYDDHYLGSGTREKMARDRFKGLPVDTGVRAGRYRWGGPGDHRGSDSLEDIRESKNETAAFGKYKHAYAAGYDSRRRLTYSYKGPRKWTFGGRSTTTVNVDFGRESVMASYGYVASGDLNSLYEIFSDTDDVHAATKTAGGYALQTMMTERGKYGTVASKIEKSKHYDELAQESAERRASLANAYFS